MVAPGRPSCVCAPNPVCSGKIDGSMVKVVRYLWILSMRREIKLTVHMVRTRRAGRTFLSSTSSATSAVSPKFDASSE